MTRITRGLWRRLWLFALKAAERWPAPAPRMPNPCSWQPGLAVLIPESGTPALLDAALAGVARELAASAEPVALHVLVNGVPESDYAVLRLRHPAVRFEFDADALGYAGAIAAGLRAIGADWVLLLNSDATLEPGALAALAAARGPRIFAISAAIRTLDGPGVRAGMRGTRVPHRTPRTRLRQPGPGSVLLGLGLPPGQHADAGSGGRAHLKEPCRTQGQRTPSGDSSGLR